ncbi:MAG: hypothetical protein IPK19_42115 [Chloroflexi bacterium]|nr:hypothetical protein [Chloroflexota bacterium]
MGVPQRFRKHDCQRFTITVVEKDREQTVRTAEPVEDPRLSTLVQYSSASAGRRRTTTKIEDQLLQSAPARRGSAEPAPFYAPSCPALENLISGSI